MKKTIKEKQTSGKTLTNKKIQYNTRKDNKIIVKKRQVTIRQEKIDKKIPRK